MGRGGGGAGGEGEKGESQRGEEEGRRGKGLEGEGVWSERGEGKGLEEIPGKSRRRRRREKEWGERWIKEGRWKRRKKENQRNRGLTECL